MPLALVPKPVFIAKLSRPEPAGAMERPQLFDWLDQARERRMIWVESPAGSGKTTLIATYLDARGLDCLWYEMDEGDADPATFFHYLKRAVQQRAPSARVELPSLTPEYLPGIRVFARRYFEQLSQYLVPPCSLVIDNYQDLSDSAPLQELIADAGTRLPPGISLVIISRTGPPSAFARLRLHQDMAVLGWEDIRLTLPEAQQLAGYRNKTAQSAPSAAFIEQCHRLAEGWMAGLIVLLEQARSGEQHLPGVSRSSQRLLFDYFAQELFNRTSPETQSVLLKTALLPKLTAAMAEAITDDPGAGVVLADLQTKHFFVSKRDEVEAVYEYHPLFREFLLAGARKALSADRLRQLLIRAADLLLEAGQPEEAVVLSIEAGDWARLSVVISNLAPGCLVQGRQQTLADWLAAIPPELLHQDGWLLYWQGLTRLSDDPAAAERWLEGAYGVFTRHDDSTGLYLSWAAVVESIFLQWADFSGLDVSLNRFRELQERHPVFPSPQVEVQVYAALVIMAYRNPGTPELPGWAEHARALLESDIDNPTRLRLCAHLINYYVWKTDLNQAAWVLAVARRMADSPGIPPLYLAVSRMFGAMSAWMTGFGEECLRLVDVGIEQAHSAGLHAWDFHFNIQNVYGSLILGRTKEAEASLAAAFLLLRNHRYIDAGYYYFVAGLLAEQRGDCGTAVDYLETALSMTERGGASIPLATVHVALAVPLLRLGNAAGAAQQLERARCLSEETGSGLVRYLCELQSARMALDCGEQENAQTHLARGLSLSRECGGLVCGGWGPKVMARLYAVALDAEIEVPYIRGLIRRIGLTPADPAAAPAQWPWPIRIRTLGRFEILLDDDVLRSSGKAQRKPLDLLKALIALGGRAVPAAHLCEMLWPETDGDAAHRDFSTTLHRLRKLLMNDKALRIENGCLSLDENRVWVDVWAFQKQVAGIEAAKEGARDRAELAAALSLYRGDFLPEESSAGALSLRERLRTSYCHAVEELGSALERSGDWGSAADWYLKGLEADPLRELLYGRTMHCYERLGRRAEALALYQRCRQLFLARLGIMPGRELQAHFQRLSAIPDSPPVDGSGT